MKLRFDNQVAIVTGAANGLGRQYALLLGLRGAKVVVNDIGSTCKGEGRSTAPADNVVKEIRAAGGQAIANYDSVEYGEKIVKAAFDTWGRIDILVNNAGILRDVTLSNMSADDWDLVYRVHLKGTYSVMRAAWEYMRQQSYGRIINVTSATGLYGNFGQSNYGSAKLGVVGLTLSAAREGASRNIKVNVIAPLAGSRMTETVLPEDLIEKLKPDYVAPFVGYLAHESCKSNGGIFEMGAGWISKLRWQRSKGAYFDIKNMSIEEISKRYNEIEDFNHQPTYPQSTQDSYEPVMASFSRL